MDGRETAAAALGVSVDATKAEIRRAFRARAKRVHPDAVGSAAGLGGSNEAAGPTGLEGDDGGGRHATATLMALQEARDLLLIDAPDEREQRCTTRPADSTRPRFFTGWTADPVAVSRLDVLDESRPTDDRRAAPRVQPATVDAPSTRSQAAERAASRPAGGAVFRAAEGAVSRAARGDVFARHLADALAA